MTTKSKPAAKKHPKFGVTAGQLKKLRDTDQLSWAKVAEELKLGSPATARGSTARWCARTPSRFCSAKRRPPARATSRGCDRYQPK
jgi:hypothetical protein